MSALIWLASAFAVLLLTTTPVLSDTSGSETGLNFDTSRLAVSTAYEEVVDFRSSRAWSRFQRGEHNGIHYVLYPDGSGFASTDQRDQSTKITLYCNGLGSCQSQDSEGRIQRISLSDEPLEDALAAVSDPEDMAEYLANWMVSAAFGDLHGPQFDQPPSQVGASDQTVDVSGQTPSREATQSAPNTSPDQTVTSNEGDQPKVSLAQTSAQTIPRQAQSVSTRSNLLKSGTGNSAATETAIVQTYKPPNGFANASPEAAISVSETPAIDSQLSFAERYKLNCSITSSVSLRANNRDDDGTGIGKPRVSLGCGIRISEALSLRGAVIKYIHGEDQQDWDPDFTYALTYRASPKLSLTYSNYSAQFDGPEGNFLEGLASGNLRATYRFPEVKLPNDMKANCSGSIGLPNPTKASANLNCGVSITPKLRAGATLNFYFPGEQGEYEPDFTYTASYRISDDWRINYNNYSNNRWPWNRGESPGPRFLGGSLSVTYSLQF